MDLFTVYISNRLDFYLEIGENHLMAAKKVNKVKIDGELLRLARRYETAWHKLFYERPRFAQTLIVEEPHGRHANELARETRRLAESDEDIPVTGKAEEYLEVSGKHY